MPVRRNAVPLSSSSPRETQETGYIKHQPVHRVGARRGGRTRLNYSEAERNNVPAWWKRVLRRIATAAYVTRSRRSSCESMSNEHTTSTVKKSRRIQYAHVDGAPDEFRALAVYPIRHARQKPSTPIAFRRRSSPSRSLLNHVRTAFKTLRRLVGGSTRFGDTGRSVWNRLLTETADLKITSAVKIKYVFGPRSMWFSSRPSSGEPRETIYKSRHENILLSSSENK